MVACPFPQHNVPTRRAMRPLGERTLYGYGPDSLGSKGKVMNEMYQLVAAAAARDHNQERPVLVNKTIEAGLLRHCEGDTLLLYLTDCVTGEVEGVQWDEAPPVLKAA